MPACDITALKYFAYFFNLIYFNFIQLKMWTILTPMDALGPQVLKNINIPTCVGHEQWINLPWNVFYWLVLLFRTRPVLDLLFKFWSKSSHFACYCFAFVLIELFFILSPLQTITSPIHILTSKHSTFTDKENLQQFVL